MEALIGLLGALIGAYVTANYAEQSNHRSQLGALADFLEAIADCLERMEKSLRNDVVPTDDGHRLEQIVHDFASAVRGAPLDSEWKKKTESLRSQLQQHLHDGEIIDDIIRGHVLRAPSDAKERMLHSMAVTCCVPQIFYLPSLQGFAQLRHWTSAL
jgi:hypothetical protein